MEQMTQLQALSPQGGSSPAPRKPDPSAGGGEDFDRSLEAAARREEAGRAEARHRERQEANPQARASEDDGASRRSTDAGADNARAEKTVPPTEAQARRAGQTDANKSVPPTESSAQSQVRQALQRAADADTAQERQAALRQILDSGVSMDQLKGLLKDAGQDGSALAQQLQNLADGQSLNGQEGLDQLKELVDRFAEADNPRQRQQALLDLIGQGGSPEELISQLEALGSDGADMARQLQELFQAQADGNRQDLLSQLRDMLDLQPGAQDTPRAEEAFALLQQAQSALQSWSNGEGRFSSGGGQAVNGSGQGGSGRYFAFGFVSTQSTVLSGNGSGAQEIQFQQRTTAAWVASSTQGGNGPGTGGNWSNLLQAMTGQGASGQGNGSATGQNTQFAEALKAMDNATGQDGRDAFGMRGDGSQRANSSGPSGLKGAAGTRLVQGEQSVQRATVQIAKEAADGQRDVRIKLHPPHLGQVRVEMQMADNRVNAIVHVDNRAAAQQLGEQLNQLRQAFQDQGLDLEDLQVEVGSEQGDDAGEHQEEFMAGNGSGGNGQAGDGTDDEEGGAEADAETQDVGLSDDSLSVYA